MGSKGEGEGKEVIGRGEGKEEERVEGGGGRGSATKATSGN